MRPAVALLHLGVKGFGALAPVNILRFSTIQCTTVHVHVGIALEICCNERLVFLIPITGLLHKM
jgi:hypothetical protein